MKKQDQQYFSEQLHKLADKFNSTVGKWFEPPVVKKFTAAQRKSVEKQTDNVMKLNAEFNARGYTNRQWNNFLKTSGVAKKMGLYGGAFKLLSARAMKDLKARVNKKLKRVDELNNPKK